MTAADQQKTPWWKWPFRVQVLLGLLLFLGVNCFCLILDPFKNVDPESLPAAHTWVWWATREFLQEKIAPPVVILGASFVMHPISLSDADFLNRDLDYVHHHRSEFMEAMLKARLPVKDARCFNFALPGGMVSDDYMIARSLFTEGRKPKLLIVGLSMRDFMDSGVHSAGATPAFRYLKRFTDVDDLVDLSMPKLQQRLDYHIGRLLYLWGNKLDMQVVFSEESKRLLSGWKTNCLTSRLDGADIERNMPSNQRAEVETGWFIVQSHRPYTFTDNTAEYRKRYRTSNDAVFAAQTIFLNKLLELCRDNQTQVLLVNMPLTKSNMNLMPAGSYDRYLNVLANSASRFDCRFIDLNKNASFKQSDFYDTAHMTGSGGKKLVEALVETISGTKALAHSLIDRGSSGIHLAGSKQPL